MENERGREHNQVFRFASFTVYGLQFTVYGGERKITDWEILVYLLPYWTKLLGIAYGSD
jgi:hypothetical protein